MTRGHGGRGSGVEPGPGDRAGGGRGPAAAPGVAGGAAGRQRPRAGLVLAADRGRAGREPAGGAQEVPPDRGLGSLGRRDVRTVHREGPHGRRAGAAGSPGAGRLRDRHRARAAGVARGAGQPGRHGPGRLLGPAGGPRGRPGRARAGAGRRRISRGRRRPRRARDRPRRGAPARRGGVRPRRAGPGPAPSGLRSAATSRSPRSRRRLWSCRCARRWRCGTTTSAPSTCCWACCTARAPRTTCWWREGCCWTSRG